MSKIMITDAHSGLGKKCAHQLAQYEDIDTLYLACRDPHKAAACQEWKPAPDAASSRS